MPRRTRVALRRTWRPPPDWPKAPRGFVPPAGWIPDPSWPAPPEGWRWWQVRRGVLVTVAALGVLAILSVRGNLSDAASVHDYRALKARGVTTSAKVVRSSYDEGGGDPNGWTTETVRFRDVTGADIQTVVGHHDTDRPERSSGQIEIVFDPQHPTIASTVANFEQFPPVAGFIAGLVVSLIVAVTLLMMMSFAAKLTIVSPAN
jgi:hypothetical protein